MRKFLIILVLAISLSVPFQKQTLAVSLDECSQENISQDKINDCIDLLSNKVNDLANQKKTLAGQIEQFDSQIQITQLKIVDAQTTIAQLEKEIGVLNFRIGYISDSVGRLEQLLKQRIRATYQQSFVSNLEVLVTSKDFSELMLRVQYLKQVQENDRKILTNLQQTKASYGTQKDDRQVKQKAIEESKKKLEDLQTSLNGQKEAEQALLTATQNDENKYQSLLGAAQAQLSAFKSFASSQGGASILPQQPSPDGWYYNQRDERWGNSHIGSSDEPVWEVGCLLTSVAMVMKKHGEDVTPASVASNSSYYFSDTAYMLIPWAGGKFNSNNWNYNQSDIDSKLSGGEPVIVGLKAGPYGEHFVVLKSGSGGDYTIDDPWNGPDLKFSDYYSTSEIFQYGYYQ